MPDAVEPGSLLVIGIHDVPRSPLAVGVLEHYVLGPRIVHPTLAGFNVHRAEFPTLDWILDALLETPLLLFVVHRDHRLFEQLGAVGGVLGWCLLRTNGVALFDTVQVSPGFVFGSSLISNPIGQEGKHQIAHQGSDKALFYLGFDLAFALAKLPDTELVFRIQHRSGAYGTLGAMREGNNANVVAIRQRF
jgi:hypothetical protein